MAKKKSAFNILNIVDQSQLMDIDKTLEVLNTPNSKIAPTEKEVELVKSAEGDVLMIPLSQLTGYHNHTFKVLDNNDMAQLVDSIRDYGIILPLIVREQNGGKYEIISGHRRRFAAEKLGLEAVPCKVMDLDDDMADIVMADTNIARETILPSEKAKTYKVRLEAAIRQGKKTEAELKNMADESPDSPSGIRRYLKLNDLSPALLDSVDDGSIPVTAGVILSELSPAHQQTIADIASESEVFPTLKTAEQLKKASARGLSRETAEAILTGKRQARSSAKKPRKLTEDMLLDAVPDRIKELPLDERVDYYKKAISAYASDETQN